jgi:hypothetical protein
VLFSTDLEQDTQATMERVHRFLGLSAAPTVTAGRWNRQSNPELSERLRDRLREGFAVSDEAVARRLGRAVPWSDPQR